MKSRKGIKFILFNFLLVESIVFLFLTVDVHGWDSVDFPGSDISTHKEIGKDAVYILDPLQYPDMWRYIDEIGSGSETESHNTGPTKTDNDMYANGGYPQAWWDQGAGGDNALAYYKSFNFTKAYEYIGRVCHLIQDQAVPAHAANIAHGFLAGSIYHFDKLENAADDHYHDEMIFFSPKSGCTKPYEYYQCCMDETISKLEGFDWVDPETGLEYWLTDDMDGVPDGEGSYGGWDFEDIYDYEKSPEIVFSQIKQAGDYTAGALIAASKLLPPLVRNLSIFGAPSNAPIIDKEEGSEISFEVLENRKSTVYIFMTVDSPYGEPIISSEYGTGKSESLSEGGTELPYEGTFAVIWNGKLANGQYPVEGEHTLYVWAEDRDDNNNKSPYATHNFSIDNYPPPSPFLDSPFNASVISTTQPMLTWIQPPDLDGDVIERSQVFISTDYWGDELVLDTGQIPGTTAYQVPAGYLQEGETYYWKVRSHDGKIWGDWPIPWSFYIEQQVPNNPPSSPIPTSPQGYIEIVTPTLVWTQAVDPDGDTITKNRIQIKRNETIVYDSNSINATTSLTIPSGYLNDGQTYYWQVQAYDGELWGGWSPPLNFTVAIDCRPPEVEINSLPYNSTNQTEITFTGTATDVEAGNSNVASVEYQIDNMEGVWLPANIIGGAGTPTVDWNFTISPLTENTIHKVYVRATDEDNYISTPISYAFTVDTIPPEVLTVYPLDYTHIEIIFNESMDKITTEDIANYTIDNGLIVTEVSLREDNKTVVLSTSQHIWKTEYALQVGNITDCAGNEIDAGKQHVFIGLPQQPWVAYAIPEDEAQEVYVNAQIIVVFNTDMDVTTLNSSTVYIKAEGSDDIVQGVYQYETAGKKLIFTPSSALEPGKGYIGEVSTETTSQTGEPLIENYQWEFTTMSKGLYDFEWTVTANGTESWTAYPEQTFTWTVTGKAKETVETLVEKQDLYLCINTKTVIVGYDDYGVPIYRQDPDSTSNVFRGYSYRPNGHKMVLKTYDNNTNCSLEIVGVSGAYLSINTGAYEYGKTVEKYVTLGQQDYTVILRVSSKTPSSGVGLDTKWAYGEIWHVEAETSTYWPTKTVSGSGVVDAFHNPIPNGKNVGSYSGAQPSPTHGGGLSDFTYYFSNVSDSDVSLSFSSASIVSNTVQYPGYVYASTNYADVGSELMTATQTGIGVVLLGQLYSATYNLTLEPPSHAGAGTISDINVGLSFGDDITWIEIEKENEVINGYSISGEIKATLQIEPPVIDLLPGDNTISAAPTFTGTASDEFTGSTEITFVECQLDGTDGVWQPADITSGAGTSRVNWSFIPSLLTKEEHTIYVRAIDGEGYISFPAAYTFSIVSKPPVAQDDFITIDEDISTEIALQATDANGDPLSYLIISPSSHGTVSLDGNIAIYTPDENYYGPDSFTFKVNDGESDSNVATVSITVSPINDPPILESIGSKEVNEGELLEFTVTAEDIDGDHLSDTALYVEELPAGAEFNIQMRPQIYPNPQISGIFTWTPSYLQAGEYNVTFKVEDGDGEEASEIITIRVRDLNAPPVTLDTNIVTDEDAPIEITLPASDVDGDILTYSIIDSPVHGSLGVSNPETNLLVGVSNMSLLHFSPVYGYTCPYDLCVCEDEAYFYYGNPDAGGGGANAGEVYVLDVSNPAAPFIEGSGPSFSSSYDMYHIIGLQVAGGDLQQVAFVAARSHGLQRIDAYTSYLLDFVEIPGTAYDVYVYNKHIEVEYSPRGFTESCIYAAAGDAGLRIMSMYYSGMSEIGFYQTPCAYGVYASEYYAYVADATGLYIIDVTDPSAPAQVGFFETPEEAKAVYVYDNYAYVCAGKVYVIDVTDPSNPVYLSSCNTFSALEVYVTDSYIYVLDRINGAVLSMKIFNVKPGEINKVIYTPEKDYYGSDSFTFKVNDGEFDSNVAAVSITVSPISDPPILEPIGNKEVNEGELLEFTVTAKDIDGDHLSDTALSVEELPEGATFEVLLPEIYPNPQASGIFTWTPNYLQAGEYNVTFKVEDGDGEEASETITIRVNDLNAPPVSLDTNIVTDEDAPIEITLPASDVDGDILTYNIIDLPTHGSLDVSNPETNLLVGVLNMGFLQLSHTYGPTCFYDLCICEDEAYFHYGNPNAGGGGANAGEVYVLDVSNPVAPVIESSGPSFFSIIDMGVYDIRGLQVAGGDLQPIAFVAARNYGLQRIDAYTLYLLDFVEIPGTAYDVYVYNKHIEEEYPEGDTESYIYAAAGDAGLRIMNTDYSGTPEIGFYQTPCAYGVYASEYYAYVADASGLYIIDVTDPSAPAQVGFFETPEEAKAVYVYDNYAYVCAGKVYVIDVTNPSNPVYLSSCDTSSALEVYVVDDYIYVLDRISEEIVSMKIFNVKPGEINKVIYTPEKDYYGQDSFTFKVNDGEFDSNVTTVSIIVSPIEDLLALEPIGNKEVNEGELLEFTISATGVDEGDVLTYSASNLPAGATFNPNSRTFRWKPAYTQAGEYNVIFKVINDKGESCDETVIMKVNNMVDIIDLTLSSDDINFINNGSIEVFVHNFGDLPAVDVEVVLYDGNPENNPGSDKKIGNRIISEISGESTAAVRFDLRSLSLDQHALFVWIDPYNEITEGDEDNNVAFSYVSLTVLATPILWNKLGSEYEVQHSEVGQDGEIVGDVYFEACQHGNGFRSAVRTGDPDIPDNYIRFSNVELGPQGCIEFWYQPDWKNSWDIGNCTTLISFAKYNDTSVGYLHLHYNDWQGLLSCEAKGNDLVSSAVEFPPASQSNWTTSEPFHIAFVWDAFAEIDKVWVYINGEIINGTPYMKDSTFIWEEPLDLVVGCRQWEGDWYRHHWEPNTKGVIDDLKIWNYAKTDFSEKRVVIDGNFDDWNGIVPLGTDKWGDITDGDFVDWATLWAFDKSEILYLSYKTVEDVDFTNNAWRYGIYIDTDCNPETGFKGPAENYNTGAEYLIEGALLHQYAGDGTSWEWDLIGLLDYAYSGNRVEMAVDESKLGLSEGDYPVQIMLLGTNPTAVDYAKDDRTGFIYPKGVLVQIDGEFNDWNEVVPIGTDSSGDVSAGDIVDWEELWAWDVGGRLYLSYQTASAVDFTDNAWRYGIYIDTDCNPETGFKGPAENYNTGAEYLIEGALLHQYAGDGTSWEWDLIGLLDYAYSGNRVEMVIDESKLGLSEGDYAVQIMLLGTNPATTDYAKDDRIGFVYKKGRQLILWNKLGSEYEVQHSKVGQDGEIVGDVYFEACQHGNGFRSAVRTGDPDIPDNYIRFSNIELGPQGCIEFWYHPDWKSSSEIGNCTTLVSFAEYNDTSVGYLHLHYNDWQGLLSCSARGNDLVGSAVEFPPANQSNWTTSEPFHIAFVWDAFAEIDKVWVYINGEIINGTPYMRDSTFIWAEPLDLVVGCRQWEGDWYRHHWEPNTKGVIDDLKIWNYPKRDF